MEAYGLTKEPVGVKGAEAHVQRIRGERTKVKTNSFEFTFRKSTEEMKRQAEETYKILERGSNERRIKREREYEKKREKERAEEKRDEEKLQSPIKGKNSGERTEGEKVLEEHKKVRREKESEEEIKREEDTIKKEVEKIMRKRRRSGRSKFKITNLKLGGLWEGDNPNHGRPSNDCELAGGLRGREHGYTCLHPPLLLSSRLKGPENPDTRI